MYCNDFGFFRAPNVQNIEWFDETAIYTPASLIEWSKRQDDDLQRHKSLPAPEVNDKGSIHRLP